MSIDLISREAAIAEIREQLDLEEETECSKISAADAFVIAIRRVKKLPAVDAEPVRHGRWIGVEYDGYADGNPVYDLWECSECGEEHEGEEDTLTNYCPNCGAKMDGGAE